MCKIKLTNTQEHKNHSHEESLFRIQAVSFLKGPVVSSPGSRCALGSPWEAAPPPAWGSPELGASTAVGTPSWLLHRAGLWLVTRKGLFSTESCRWESSKEEPRVKAQTCLLCLLQLLSQGHPKLEEIVSLPGLAQGPPLGEAFRCRAWCWCQTCSGHR